MLKKLKKSKFYLEAFLFSCLKNWFQELQELEFANLTQEFKKVNFSSKINEDKILIKLQTSDSTLAGYLKTESEEIKSFIKNKLNSDERFKNYNLDLKVSTI